MGYSDEKPYIPFLVREVQPAVKPAKARVEEEKGARPFGPVQAAATEGWRTRPWPFTPRAEPQPVTKSAKARVEEKGVWPFSPVSIAATEGWRTRPWPFTPRAGQAISIEGPVADETFEMANDEELVEKALMASSSVAVTSKDSANSSLATLMAPAESLPDEVREPLSGGASTPLSGGAPTPCVKGSINASDRGNINAFVRESINAFGSMNAEWSESVARNSATFAAPRAGYSKNGARYTQQQDSSAQRRHAACCRGADGRGYPLQGSTPKEK